MTTLTGFSRNIVTITVNQVLNTEAYKSLSPIRQKLARNWNNIKSIDNSVQVAKSIGLENWLKETQANDINRAIVTELVK
jgi:hypothetical protein